MKILTKPTNILIGAGILFGGFCAQAQTNVFDDVISTSPNHTSLTLALEAAELDDDLQNPNANFTVFAPDDNAFQALADALELTVPDLLELPNLADILLYHVLDSEVGSSAINNGDIVTPLNDANTIKLTATSGGDVFANQAQVNAADLNADNGVVHSLDAVILSDETVVDIAIDNNFTSLTAAVVTAELLPALTNPFANFTVFAPSDAAFNNLASALGTDLEGVLANPELASILTYHVLGEEVMSSMINNGDLVTPLNDANTIKLTVTSEGDVFANQAQVELPDVTADNGVVHAIDAVILSSETVVDIAIDNNFTALATAVITAELLPALTDPFATFTVFAPSDAAFNELADELGTDLDGILNNPELAAILTYHVLGEEVMSSMISNGDLVTPLNDANTIKLTVTSEGDVFANQAQVELPDVAADNGVVHAIDAVILSSETVVDIAIDNNFSALATAVVTAELLPALTDPFAELTVFAPTDQAFSDLAEALETDLDGILALPNLGDILLYHVTAGELLAADLTDGELEMLNGEDVLVDLSEGVQVNNATVTGPNNIAENGVVHIINAVLDQGFLSVSDLEVVDIDIYPNPAVDFLRIQGFERGTYSVFSTTGALVKQGIINGTREVNLSDLEEGVYILNVQNEESISNARFVKM
jgi:transforming growth factor-beta-induced protein